MEKNKGITLVALVITIIILLILAGITIQLTMGEQGIFKKATQARQESQIGTTKEKIILAVTDAQIQGYGNMNKNDLETSLIEQFGRDNIKSIHQAGKSFLITFSDDKSYYINNTGNVVEDEKIYKIASATDFVSFRDMVNQDEQTAKRYEVAYVTNDIDMSSVSSETSENWIPIGTQTNHFTKVFDGGNYTIRGLYIKDENERYKGLFGYNKGIIQNVVIGSDCYIMGKGNTGAVAGYNLGIIQNCINQGTVQSNYNNTGRYCWSK